MSDQEEKYDDPGLMAEDGSMIESQNQPSRPRRTTTLRYLLYLLFGGFGLFGTGGAFGYYLGRRAQIVVNDDFLSDLERVEAQRKLQGKGGGCLGGTLCCLKVVGCAAACVAE